MKEVKIEKGIPIPENFGRHPCKYPFGKMLVGESFFWSEDKVKLGQAASYYGKRHNMKFTIRKEIAGARCWRVK